MGVINEAERKIIEKIREQFAVVNSESNEGLKMGAVEIVGLALSVFDKLLDKAPNYDQQKKNKYFRLKKEYLEILQSSERDMNLLLNLRDELLLMVQTYSDEIGANK